MYELLPCFLKNVFWLTVVKHASCCFHSKKMRITVFGNSSSSHNIGIKTDTSLILQKPYLRAKHLESKKEEDNSKKNLFKITNLKNLTSIREAVSKKYVQSLSNDPSL